MEFRAVVSVTFPSLGDAARQVRVARSRSVHRRGEAEVVVRSLARVADQWRFAAADDAPGWLAASSRRRARAKSTAAACADGRGGVVGAGARANASATVLFSSSGGCGDRPDLARRRQSSCAPRDRLGRLDPARGAALRLPSVSTHPLSAVRSPRRAEEFHRPQRRRAAPHQRREPEISGSD